MCFKTKEQLNKHNMESHSKIKKKSVKPKKNSKKTKKSIKPRKNSRRSMSAKNSKRSMSPKNSKNSECKESFQKKYQTRPSPPYPAQACKNSIILGNDDEYYYKSSPDKNGIYKWKIFNKKEDY